MAKFVVTQWVDDGGVIKATDGSSWRLYNRQTGAVSSIARAPAANLQRHSVTPPAPAAAPVNPNQQPGPAPQVPPGSPQGGGMNKQAMWAFVFGGVMVAVVMLAYTSDRNVPQFGGDPSRFQQQMRSEPTAAEIAAAAYKALGPAPNGAKLEGHSVIPINSEFICPDGRPGKKVKSANGNVGGREAVHRRWDCSPGRWK